MIISLLADAQDQITPPPGFSEWLANLMYIIVSAAGVRHFLNQGKKPEKQQREIVGDSITVKAAVAFAKEEDLRRVDGELDRLQNDLNASITAAHEDHNQKTRLLFKKVDDLHQHIAATKDSLLKSGEERLEAITGQVNALTAVMHDRISATNQTLAGTAATLEALNRRVDRIEDQGCAGSGRKH